MSGPFTKAQIHDILGRHFVSSPLGVVEKAGEPGKFHIVWDLSFENEDGYSVNGHLDSDNFPTEWGTASQVADIVSTLLWFQAPFQLLLLWHPHFSIYLSSFTRCFHSAELHLQLPSCLSTASVSSHRHTPQCFLLRHIIRGISRLLFAYWYA